MVSRLRHLLDAGFVVVLGLLAIYSLHSTFTTYEFLAVAAIGLLIGIAVEYAVGLIRGPVVLTAVGLIAAYFLFGGAVALRGDPAATWWPSGGTLSALTDVLVHGWRELLTTLPPVIGSGKMLYIPFLLGLLGGGFGFALARRTRSAAAPILPPVLVAVAAILLGTAANGATPTDTAVVIAGFTILALAWAALRSQRTFAHNSVARGSRLATAAALLVAGGVGAVIVDANLDPSTAQRLVLREYVQPPLDLSTLPSPLSGFRKYTASAEALWDKELLAVDGLPDVGVVRIAVMTEYTGTAWVVGADGDSGLYQRVGAEIPSSQGGESSAVTVTIGSAYAAAYDLNVWVPSTGAPSQIGFEGPQQKDHEESLRFNLETGTAVVPDRLTSGDTVLLQTVLGSTDVPRQAEPYAGGGQLDPQSYAFVIPTVTKWTASIGGTAWERLLAVASYLRTNGTYTDGAKGETQYLPGHGLGRLAGFIGDQQLAGDDEQYAATFALMAGSLGFPSRVVLGATNAAGTVTGENVHAWVEVRIANGTWVSIYNDEFMPEQSKRPKPPTENEVSDSNGAVVPPPNATRPPSSLDRFDSDDTNAASRKRVSPDDGVILPAWLSTLLLWGGPPVGLITLFVLVVVGAKMLRRRRRRTHGPPSARVAAGWSEVLSQAKDLGQSLPPSSTRVEQARALSAYNLEDLADAADRGVFAPEHPTTESVNVFWTQVAAARKQMRGTHPVLRRIRAALNPRSLVSNR